MSALSSSMDAIAIAIMGSGGAGAITAGSLLLEAAGRIGWYGLMTRSVGPQIRGGEALAMVRLAPVPVRGHGDRFDVLLALDWHNADRFVDEAPLDADSLIIADAGAGDPPAAMLASGARLVTLPLADLAGGVPGGRVQHHRAWRLGAAAGFAAGAAGGGGRARPEPQGSRMPRSCGRRWQPVMPPLPCWTAPSSRHGCPRTVGRAGC